MSIRYDWVIETVNVTDEDTHDVEDLDYRDSYADALVVIERNPLPPGYKYDIGLMRRQFSTDEQDFLLNEQFAYVYDGALESRFDGGAKVPAKYLNEVAA